MVLLYLKSHPIAQLRNITRLCTSTVNHGTVGYQVKEEQMSNEYQRTVSGTITFRTAEQAAIFDCELTGQFSDGHWENLRGDHWMVWCKAEVKVGENVGRDFFASKDNYNVSAKELLEVVGERMKGYARIAKVLGLGAAQKMRYFVNWDNGKLERPTTGVGEKYWDDKRAEYDAFVAQVGQEAIDRINSTVYEQKHLIADLREIKRTMKTCLRLGADGWK